MGFSRKEYWSGLTFPSLEDLPNPGIKLGSLALQADSLPIELLQGRPPRNLEDNINMKSDMRILRALKGEKETDA